MNQLIPLLGGIIVALMALDILITFAPKLRRRTKKLVQRALG